MPALTLREVVLALESGPRRRARTSHGPGARLMGVSVHGTRDVGTVDRAARTLGGAVLRAAFPGDMLALCGRWRRRSAGRASAARPPAAGAAENA